MGVYVLQTVSMFILGRRDAQNEETGNQFYKSAYWDGWP